MSAKNKKSILLTLCTKTQGIHFWKQFAAILFSFWALAFFVTLIKCTKWEVGKRESLTKIFPKQKFMHLSWCMYVESFHFLSSIMKEFF